MTDDKASERCTCGSHKLAPLYHRPDCPAASAIQRGESVAVDKASEVALEIVEVVWTRVRRYKDGDIGLDTLKAQQIVAALLRTHLGEERWKEAVRKLLDYIEAHDWGTIPEPHDSIKDLLVLMGEPAGPKVSSLPGQDSM